MNLFVLDRMPVQAARFNCDSHVRKIILESVEMMSYAYPKGATKKAPWGHWKMGSHLNHPMSLWVRATRQNFDWALQHAYGLCEEYTFRFNKIHACQSYFDWISYNLPLQNLRDYQLTDWPRCFGAYKEIIGVSENAVYDYRRYYMMAKRDLAEWTKRGAPEWFR